MRTSITCACVFLPYPTPSPHCVFPPHSPHPCIHCTSLFMCRSSLHRRCPFVITLPVCPVARTHVPGHCPRFPVAAGQIVNHGLGVVNPLEKPGTGRKGDHLVKRVTRWGGARKRGVEQRPGDVTVVAAVLLCACIHAHSVGYTLCTQPPSCPYLVLAYLQLAPCSLGILVDQVVDQAEKLLHDSILPQIIPPTFDQLLMLTVCTCVDCVHGCAF